MFEDRPKLLGNSKALDARLMQIEEIHIAPLTNFVRELQERMGREVSIPYFDPWDGSVETEVLYLLEAPGPKAVNSGFISRNNPDETAKNFFELNRDAGIHRRRTVIWNIVPWYIGNGSRIRAAKSEDIAQGRDSLVHLFEHLPKLRAVVLVGAKAQKVEKELTQLNSSLAVFSCPHPSPMFVNRSPGNRNIILEKLKAIQDFLEH
ncbi:uracil-DNA glycosylase [Methylobacter sp. YRD-M1]|uniref:uracil-DNA glycosylase n=1 Tax=Methylobacter sp. YRD-M1 TaxID=2911520 RepID=UPI00227ABA62|nr:uracil-DNA glycosylase [Methylobacter sp. YRD-M1]WAK04460.1 uracil-DNA glycosylase [Methylobacter sp. YRD-M1]